MKKLLLAVLFLGGMTAQANTVTDLDHNTRTGIRYNQPQAITFVERGVEFVVFANGQFDFALVGPRFQNRNQGRRNVGYNAPGHAYGVSYRNDYNSFIRYDYYGDISKVGRNHISYNRFGEVNQIGSVRLRYNNGLLTRVGGMELIYNRRGRLVDLIGYVHNDRGRNGHRKFKNRRAYNDGYISDWDYDKRGKKWHGKNAYKKNKKYKKDKSRRYDD